MGSFCGACGWEGGDIIPPSREEPPIVCGALDAQADAERALSKERKTCVRLERKLQALYDTMGCTAEECAEVLQRLMEDSLALARLRREVAMVQ